jgi:WD40 repeat protein
LRSSADNPFRWLDRSRTTAAYQGQFLVVWDLPGRRRLATLRIGPSGFYLGDDDHDVDFSPDGRYVAVADDGPEVILWDRDARSWSRSLCQMVDRDLTGQERRRFLPGGRDRPTCEG